MTDQLTDAERAAIAVWNSRFSSEDTMLAAVRAAVAVTERGYEMSEDARLALLEQTLDEVKSMLRRFDTPADAGRVRAFVGDLNQILSRIPR
jgi:hypothetical protein